MCCYKMVIESGGMCRGPDTTKRQTQHHHRRLRISSLAILIIRKAPLDQGYFKGYSTSVGPNLCADGSVRRLMGVAAKSVMRILTVY
jgi:hypothetical protein